MTVEQNRDDHQYETPSQGAWRPIETVPKGPLDKFQYGPTILLWVEDQIGIGFWDKDFGNFYLEYPEFSRNMGTPTHWMPLPAPPHSAPMTDDPIAGTAST